MTTRIVAILAGGDWYDASVEHLAVPTTVSLDEARAEYDRWYREEYITRKDRQYRSFAQWLVERCGARDAEDSDVEVYWDT